MTSVPIIGNGDIWTVEDINRYFDYTNAHSVMIARGALKTPWLARNFKNHILSETPYSRVKDMKFYYYKYFDQIKDQAGEELGKIRRLKAVSRYLFDDLPNAVSIKKRFLLTKTKEDMFEVIDNLENLILQN